jgi:hypothetical protein
VAGNGVHGEEAVVVVAPVVEAGNSASVRIGDGRSSEKRPAGTPPPGVAEPGLAEGDSAVGLPEHPVTRTSAARAQPAAAGILSNIMRTSGATWSKTSARSKSTGIRKLSRQAFAP